MTRSNAREIAVHLAFELSFSNETADQLLETAMTRSIFALLGEETPLYAEFPNEKQRGYIETLARGVYLHCAELDEYISRYAIGWEFSRLPRVSIAIMRVAMYEILYMQDVPNAAAINEAVELAKHYEDQDMVSFINGILGSFVRRESIPERTPVMAEGIFDAESEQGEQ
jgi:N utilization substance protein B